MTSHVCSGRASRRISLERFKEVARASVDAHRGPSRVRGRRVRRISPRKALAHDDASRARTVESGAGAGETRASSTSSRRRVTSPPPQWSGQMGSAAVWICSYAPYLASGGRGPTAEGMLTPPVDSHQMHLFTHPNGVRLASAPRAAHLSPGARLQVGDYALQVVLLAPHGDGNPAYDAAFAHPGGSIPRRTLGREEEASWEEALLSWFGLGEEDRNPPPRPDYPSAPVDAYPPPRAQAAPAPAHARVVPRAFVSVDADSNAATGTKATGTKATTKKPDATQGAAAEPRRSRETRGVGGGRHHRNDSRRRRRRRHRWFAEGRDGTAPFADGRDGSGSVHDGVSSSEGVRDRVADRVAATSNASTVEKERGARVDAPPRSVPPSPSPSSELVAPSFAPVASLSSASPSRRREATPRSSFDGSRETRTVRDGRVRYPGVGQGGDDATQSRQRLGERRGRRPVRVEVRLSRVDDGARGGAPATKGVKDTPAVVRNSRASVAGTVAASVGGSTDGELDALRARLESAASERASRWRTPPLRRVPRPNLSSETTFDLWESGARASGHVRRGAVTPTGTRRRVVARGQRTGL